MSRALSSLASSSTAAPWLAPVLAQLGGNAGSGIGYLDGGAAAAEPTALAAMALAANGHLAEARRAAAWLAQQQSANGSVGVRPGEAKPGWPTSLALISWHLLDQDRNFDRAFDKPISKGSAWLLADRGTRIEQDREMGHNTTLVGWSWAENTHSWLEPTAYAVMALKALGKPDHPRATEAVRLMEDRLMPSGGCNYGNTTVFGQELRPHIQPTGIVLLALAGTGHRAKSVKVAKSIEWLSAQLNERTPAASLAWGLMGLRAQGVVPAHAAQWLATAAARVHQRDASPAKLALLVLAAHGWPGTGAA